jgi:methionyl-tRNA formyltransferase
LQDEEPASCAEAIMHSFRNRKYFLYRDIPSAIMPVKYQAPKKYSSFDPKKPVIDTVLEERLDHEIISAESLNDPEVIEAVANALPNYFLFSGGGILRAEILSLGKKFIHLHPGHIPDVRGSMAIEWSILTMGKCAVSAFFMVDQIDQGEIIARRWFDLPELEHNNVAALYSSHIRSELLLDIVRSYIENGGFTCIPQNPNVGDTFYMMHPVLNNVVFFVCQKSN